MSTVSSVECVLRGVRDFVTILSTFQQGNSRVVGIDGKTSWSGAPLLHIFMKKNGFKLMTASKGKDVYTESWISSSFFDKYIFTIDNENINNNNINSQNDSINQTEEMHCLVHLPTLLHSLLIFGVQAHVRWKYTTESTNITLCIQEENDSLSHTNKMDKTASLNGYSECIIKTFDIHEGDILPDIQKEFLSNGYEEEESFRMKPSILKEAISEFSEDASEEKVIIAVHPPTEDTTEPVLYIGMAQQLTSFQWNFVLHPVLFPEFTIQRNHTWYYKLRSLSSMNAALKCANALKISFHPEGMLSVQIYFWKDDPSRVYMNFFIKATEADDNI